MDTHLNVLSIIRLVAIVSVLAACVLFAGCAEESLTIDNRPALAGEATPPPPPGPRGGWAW